MPHILSNITAKYSPMTQAGMRPPAGSGTFFSCDEEAGEMFSNSYLADLKSGECDVEVMMMIMIMMMIIIMIMLIMLIMMMMM